MFQLSSAGVDAHDEPLFDVVLPHNIDDDDDNFGHIIIYSALRASDICLCSYLLLCLQAQDSKI